MAVLLQNEEAIFEICAVLSEQENLKVTLKEATKGALKVGFCSFVGALLGGPIGLAIGGTVSSIAVACTGNDYKPVVVILRNELTVVQKQRLVSAVNKILTNLKPQDVVQLMSLVMTTASLKEAVIKEIGSFLLKEFSYNMLK